VQTLKDGEVPVDAGAGADYILGSGEPELLRLSHVSTLYRDITCAWLTEIGLEPGMDVADLGCGLGEVTEPAAGLVGPNGSVTGVDSAEHPLDRARSHAAQAGLRHVLYRQADVDRWQPEHRLDAVIGRLILMHVADPVGLLARLAGLVRPGGLIAFQDVVLTVRRTEPELPLVATFNDWLIRTVRGLGRPADMGLRLVAVFADAGLQVEHLTAASPVERGGDAVGYAVMAGDVTSLLPHMERLGIASARDIVPGRSSTGCGPRRQPTTRC
jgi:SAM-dependent methyltransferase